MVKANARRKAFGAAILSAALLTAWSAVVAPATAQDWWPWSSSEPERPPIPDEPVYREPPPPRGGPSPDYYDAQPPPDRQPPPSAPAVNWSTKNPICLQLEQRLVQDGQSSSGMRSRLPAIEAEIDQMDRTYRQAESDLERGKCYEYFLFSKSIRRTRACIDLAQQRQQAEQRLSELEAQRQQIANSGVRSYREEIVRELARNNCGNNYVQEARRYDQGSSSVWQDEDVGNFGNRWGSYGGQSGATYRTVCVRLCDGYYFPVSFSTLPSHFDQDAEACQSRCAAPAELYYYQNPGSSMDQSVSFSSQEPYTRLRTAFRYRKELVKGCSCKEAEYVPPEGKASPGKSAGAAGSLATGWEARSEAEAQRQQ
ncbi:DUF2865 domain-containing protein [Hyphomicrobium sp. D-2]|uniref:DUF2865 domain-containing protein n=1 Tax=Hyphomicrobium sp. D-2 TaxID=3041621 RepID=UPI002456C7E5|nr:DUF2865 domain-containing protein [Hyphomicrobium sp. D-2]MDH4983006.1 DUF2865 domain-containing protein [Hyphomicrobium sp. D-2]